MTTCELLDAVKARYKLPSDYALAHFMGIARSGISSYRSGKTKLDDSIAIKVAKVLELDPGHVLACIHAERARRDDVREIWQKTAKALKRSVGALLVCLLFYSAGGQNALASTAYAGKLPTLIIMLNWLAWLRRRLRTILTGMRFNLLNPSLLLATCLLLSACGDIDDILDTSERLEARSARAEKVLDRIDQCLNAGVRLEPGPDPNTYVVHCL